MAKSGWLTSFGLASEQLQRLKLPLRVERTIKSKKGVRGSGYTGP